MKESEIVEEFGSKQIEKMELRKNRYKPLEWRGYNANTLYRLLKAEVLELHEVMEKDDKEKVRDEAIDVANLAMFIWDINR